MGNKKRDISNVKHNGMNWMWRVGGGVVALKLVTGDCQSHIKTIEEREWYERNIIAI